MRDLDLDRLDRIRVQQITPVTPANDGDATPPEPPAPAKAKHFFTVAQSADSANTSLAAFIEEHGRFSLGICDAPWSMGRSAPSNCNSISPCYTYPTMSRKALLDFDFGQAFERDAILGFWALNGWAGLAFQMLRNQGFKIKQLVAWHKVTERGSECYLPSRGPVLNKSELLIIAQRGKGLPIDPAAEKFHSIQPAVRRGHSQKPALFRDILTGLYPSTRQGNRVRRLELFSRERVPGWEAWGNQAPINVGEAPIDLEEAA